MASKFKDESGIEFDAKRYLSEPKLKLLPLECVGFMVALFALMKDSPRLGFLCDPNDVKFPISSVGLSSLTGRTQEDAERILDQIMRAQLLARTSDGILYDPEMIAKHEYRLKKQRSGGKGGQTRVLRERANRTEQSNFLLKQNVKQTSSKRKEDELINTERERNEKPNPPGEGCAHTPGPAAPTARAPNPDELTNFSFPNSENPHTSGADGVHPPTYQEDENGLLKQVLKQTLKHPLEQNEDDDLLKHPLEQNRELIVEHLTSRFQNAVKGRKKEPDQQVRESMDGMLDDGISVEAIRAEIARNGKTLPKRSCGEYSAEMWKRLKHSSGLLPNSFYAGPYLPNQAAETPQVELPPWLEFRREFEPAFCKTPQDVAIVGMWGAEFAKLNPPLTREDYRHILHCFLVDPKRQGKQETKWPGWYLTNALPILLGYHEKKRRLYSEAEEKADRINSVPARAVGDSPALPVTVEEIVKVVEIPFANEPDCVKVGEKLRERILDARFDLWFAGKSRLWREELDFVLGVPNLFLHDWIKKTFAADLRAAVKEATGSDAEVKFEIDPEIFGLARAEQTSPTRHPRTNTERKAASA